MALADRLGAMRFAGATSADGSPITGRRLPQASRAAAMGLLGLWVISISRNADRPFLAALVGLLAVSTLLVQRRWPMVTLAAAFAALLLVDAVAGANGPDDPYLLLVVWGSFGVGRFAPLRQQPWAAAGVLFFLSINVMDGEQSDLPADAIFPVMFTAAPWVLGLAVQLAHSRTRTARELAAEIAHSRDAAVERATFEERLRLARELHDVAAHSLSAVSLHAQVLRRRAEDGAAVAVDDLRRIETTAQEAMAELRRMVGVLRPAEDALALGPQPTLDDLDALVSQCRHAGQDVDLLVRGTPRVLSPGLSLTAYRIVQEALSNARRHGGAARVTVTWAVESVRLRVLSAARVGAAPAGERGHGLVGMRERAELYGGSFHAGRDGAGKWVVGVELPTAADEGARL